VQPLAQWWRYASPVPLTQHPAWFLHTHGACLQVSAMLMVHMQEPRTLCTQHAVCMAEASVQHFESWLDCAPRVQAPRVPTRVACSVLKGPRFTI
jgi:hypothetical protein